MRFAWIILVIAGAVACSSEHRTPYQKYHKDNGGYRDSITTDEIHLTTFEANSHTKQSYAEMFARYHSLENCRNEGDKYAHILAVIDKSNAKTVTKTNSDYWGPSYYYGMTPYYSRYGGYGWSTGINYVNGRTWQETYVYPNYDVIYHCANHVFEPMIAMKDISADEMKLLVKDLKGGVQVEKILPGSPNHDLRENDIILKVNGTRIEKGHQFLTYFLEGPKTVTVELLREGERKVVTVKGKEVTDEVKKNLTALKDSACHFEDVKNKSHLCGEKW